MHDAVSHVVDDDDDSCILAARKLQNDHHFELNSCKSLTCSSSRKRNDGKLGDKLSEKRNVDSNRKIPVIECEKGNAGQVRVKNGGVDVTR